MFIEEIEFLWTPVSDMTKEKIWTRCEFAQSEKHCLKDDHKMSSIDPITRASNNLSSRESEKLRFDCLKKPDICGICI